MDTFNDAMTDLLIDQEDRLFDPVGKTSFSYIALKAEKTIINGVEGASNANQN